MTLSTRLMGSRNVNVERRITNMVEKPQGTLRETAGKSVGGGRGVVAGGVSHRKQCTKGKPQNVKAEIKFTSTKKKDKRKAKSKSNM